MKDDTALDLQTTVIRYMPYFTEIRKRLLFILAVFVVAWAVGFIYYQPIVLFVMRLYDLRGVNIAFTSPFQYINLAINTGMVVGGLFVFPLIVLQILSFLKPGLKPKEYRLIMSLLPLNILLFLGGFGFGAWLMKFIIVMFSQQTTQLQIENLWDINRFLSQVFFTSFLLGIVFQFPLVLTLLLRFGILKHETVTKQRLFIYILLLIIAIMLPPTDLISLVLMFLPLAIIFEITLLLNRNIASR